MATLTTPRMELVNVFDAGYAHEFIFSYSGAQITKNRLIIKENETYSVIYDKTMTGMKLSHTVPANSLTNNTDYLVQVQVFDTDGDSSELSEVVSFSCHKNPTFEFTNVSDDMVVASSVFEAMLNYTQEDGDVIKEIIFKVYDDHQSLLSTSGSYYELVSYTYHGLKNFNTYYLQAIGRSKLGFDLDTGLHAIAIKYSSIDPNLIVVPRNNDGKILLDVTVVVTDYNTVGEVGIENEEAVIKENSSITYDLSKIDDFLVYIKAHNLYVGEIFNATLKDGIVSVSIINLDGEYYAKLTVHDSDGLRTCLMYAFIEGLTAENLATANVVFDLRKDNYLYGISATIE